MDRLHELAARHPIPVLVVVAIATVLFGLEARHVRLDSSLETLLPADDPGAEIQALARDTFGNDDVGVVGVFAEDVLTPETLAVVDELTTKIAALDGVAEVVSITTARDPVADVVDPPLLLPTKEPSAAERAELLGKVRERGIYQNLLAADGTATGVNVFFADIPESELVELGVDDAIVAIVESMRRPDLELHYTGLPHFRVHATRAMLDDLVRLVPLTVLVAIVILTASFRSVRGVVLPVATALITLVWTLGFLELTGGSLSLGSVALPPLIVIVSTVYALHVVAEVDDESSPGRDPQDVVASAVRTVGTASLITALTTAMGFGSLVVHPITSLQDLGFYAAVGIGFAYLLVIGFVPAVLALAPVRSSEAREARATRLSNVLRNLADFSIRQRASVLAIAALVVAIAMAKIPSIQADTNFLSFFKASDPVRIATDAVNERLAGAMAFSVMIEADEEGGIKRWDTLRRIRDLQDHLDALPGVDQTVSFVDYAELLDRGAQTGGGGLVLNEAGELVEAPRVESSTTFWDEPAQLGAVISLVAGSPKAFARVIDPDFTRTNLLVRTTLSRSSEISALADAVRSYAARHFPPTMRVTPTGKLVLLTRSSHDMITGQVQSLALAAFVIFVVMSVLFLSFRVGFFAMVPNLFPIVVFFGLLGATGADLNLGTSIIASIALGIAVDDTIHLMSRLSAEVRRTDDQRTAILATMSTVGKPVLYSTAILVPGFLALGFSTFVPLQEFGILSAVTIACAFAGDVIVLPALVATLRIITLWDLLRLRLGEDPQHTIPLFAHLTSWQAKIVALLGELESFEPGQAIVRQGEQGDRMYVLIEGKAEVVVHTDELGSRSVRTLGRGDVFGEMGLIRHEERTADVVAAGAVEALALDERFLTRLLRRYPFTANKILINLSRILADRLQAETRRR